MEFHPPGEWRASFAFLQADNEIAIANAATKLEEDKLIAQQQYVEQKLTLEEKGILCW